MERSRQLDRGSIYSSIMRPPSLRDSSFAAAIAQSRSSRSSAGVARGVRKADAAGHAAAFSSTAPQRNACRRQTRSRRRHSLARAPCQLSAQRAALVIVCAPPWAGRAGSSRRPGRRHGRRAALCDGRAVKRRAVSDLKAMVTSCVPFARCTSTRHPGRAPSSGPSALRAEISRTALADELGLLVAAQQRPAQARIL